MLRQPNVDVMLDGMTYKHLNEWRAYRSINPFGDERADWRIAKLAALLAEIHRNTRTRTQPYQPHEFLLDFEKKIPTRRQSSRDIFDNFLIAAGDHAAIRALKGKKGGEAERVHRILEQIEYAKTQRKPKAAK